MLSVAEALMIVLEKTGKLPPVVSPVSVDCLGRVLAEDIRSDLDSPPFAKSLRDGYALRATDVPAGGASLRVIGESAAGSAASPSLKSGEAIRIFTGAVIPANADAVVMQEDCQREGEFVRVPGNVNSGQFILPQGAEYRAGDIVLAAGGKLGPQEFGLLASVGCVSASLISMPRVGIISTGNEIVEPGLRPMGSQIRNSNGPMLQAQTTRAGGQPVYFGIVGDDKSKLAKLVADSLDSTDITLVSGGVSVGDYDHLPHLLGELGIETHFHQVWMKPGKPVLFGSRNGKLLFGLPGHPVSAFTCFELFVRPAIEKSCGENTVDLPWVMLPLDGDYSAFNERPTYLPSRLVIVDSKLAVRPNGRMNSANLNSLAGADAIMALPVGKIQYQAGHLVPTLRLTR
ncbi:molybdopterin molybdotransferase MoeA [Zavarzinella formosa]|uniref:molybdopterin molybdotransferase MoeA n=1 Tax=Zavarzinella formosa TaxID=360055 RepID=UPI0003117793|nr:gephyrin-like molybdotransferase Glp [Zavarzinella formosa]